MCRNYADFLSGEVALDWDLGKVEEEEITLQAKKITFFGEEEKLVN